MRSLPNPLGAVRCCWSISAGLEFLRKYPMGMIKNAFDWGEPFVFGVPDGQDREFFIEMGLEPGDSPSARAAEG